MGFNRCFRGPEVCRYVEASTYSREDLLHVHTPLVHKAGPYISAFHLESSQKLSRKVCRGSTYLSSLFLSLSLFSSRCHSRTPFSFVHCTLAAYTLSYTVGRKQISEGDACKNVSQLISCWRNMVVIKRAFLLYGTYSKTSRVAQSSSGKAAVREYFTLMCHLACGYSYQTIL